MVRVLLVLALLIHTGVVYAQTSEESDEEESRGDGIELDFSFDYDPDELRESIRDKIRSKRVWGAMGLAGYHIFPAADTGPWQGPPQRFWSNGFGTSLWRDPITGWQLQ